MNLKHQFTELPFFGDRRGSECFTWGLPTPCTQKIATECLLSLMENLSLPFSTLPSACLLRALVRVSSLMRHTKWMKINTASANCWFRRQTLESNQTHSLSTSWEITEKTLRAVCGAGCRVKPKQLNARQKRSTRESWQIKEETWVELICFGVLCLKCWRFDTCLLFWLGFGWMNFTRISMFDRFRFWVA